MYIRSVPPKKDDVILKDGVVDKLELTWEKYNVSDLTEVKVTIPLNGVHKSSTTWEYPSDVDDAYPFRPTATHDIESGVTNVERVIGYKGFDSATPVDTYTVTVNYIDPYFQADDIDLNITETQLYDIAEKSTLTYANGGTVDGISNTETFAGHSSSWANAYLSMLAKHELTPEFLEWSN